jgi:NitT/TauT family transport system substrate-binding protein
MKLFTAKRFAGGLALALASLWPGACEGKKEVPQNAAETVYELSVGQTGTGIKSSMVVLAKELGLYANEGLKVVFKDISSLNDGIVGIMSDKLDILPMGVIPTCTFYSQGADLAIFGGTIAEGSQLVTRPENFQTFQSLEGFRGRTIACVRQETGHMIMKGKLREAGILPGADLTFIELDGFQSVVQAVLKGEADAGFTNSGFGQNAVRQGLVVAFDTAHYAPDAVCCRQTASGEKLRNNSEPYIRFQTANLEAYKLYLEDRGRVIDTLTAYSGLERAYVENCMYDGVMKISMDPMKIRVGEFYQTMRDNGDIKAEAKQDISGAVETAVYREALERMHKRYPEWEEYEALLKAYNANN